MWPRLTFCRINLPFLAYGRVVIASSSDSLEIYFVKDFNDKPQNKHFFSLKRFLLLTNSKWLLVLTFELDACASHAVKSV